MTTTTKTRRKPRAKASSDASRLPHHRKREIIGLIIMAVAILCSLALITYSPADKQIVDNFSLDEVLHPAQRAHNALGILGAWIARLLVPSFLGYNVLLLSGLTLAWGYVVLRGHRLKGFPFLSCILILGTVVSACLFGWFSRSLDRDLFLWSGTWGYGISEWLRYVFGAAGSLILLLLSLSIIGLLALSGDIQHLMERVERALLAIRSAFTGFWSGMRDRRAERKAERGRELQKWDELDENPAVQGRDDKKSAAPAKLPERRPAALNGNGSDNQSRTDETRVDLDDFFRTPPPRRASDNSATPKPKDDGFQPTLTVQERIEEERTNRIERETEIPDDEFSYRFPPVDILDEAPEDEQKIDYEELEENKQVLLDKLETYNIEIADIKAIVGPTVTLYELTPAPGIKISRITSLADDIAMAMAARGIRMIAPIPGKSAIGVEIPNRHRELVRIRDLIGTTKFRDTKMELPVAIGKTVEGEVYMEDLAKMPHLLIAGATGSGKSVGVNTLITGLLYACHPANLKFVLIDPKKIELQQYARIIDHYGAISPITDDPIITDFTLALGVLKSCEKEMERRYDVLSKATVRGVKDYNKKIQSGQLKAEDGHEHLPYIVVIVDELADLMMTAGKDIEGPIARLAQMARAVGIHLVLATQRPSVDVITGLIKANFPSRMAYQVASKIDSRTILDQNGAEGLVGNGDLLYMNGSRMIRLQGPFISVDEVDEITTYVEAQPGAGPYLLPDIDSDATLDAAGMTEIDDIDDLFEEAARVIVRNQQGSVSLLQRKLSIGYTRAARIVDQLEEAGIVGAFEGSRARAVLVEDEFQLDRVLNAQKEQP
ncbi:MAG TPA: DNA translocase FtsK [Rhodothermales bacterium]|nr:DNA translocase FtsK [Rhodothermales bacterium]